jgi:acetate kinase
MQILTLNSGSSSIKFSVFASDRDGLSADSESKTTCVLEGQLTNIGSREATLQVSLGEKTAVSNEVSVEALTVEQAVSCVLETIARSSRPDVDAVGYRVVHPGPNLHTHQQITPELLGELEKAIEFAPLHDPEAVTLIRETMTLFPRVPHYACFDTVFHETMPEEATAYPLPPIYRETGVHRYGFHGLSCESIVRQMRALGRLPKRMVVAHLGSGCSVTAIVDGASVDTTMGLTPTGGLVMGTRSGDLDPGLVLYLLRQQSGNRNEAIIAVETLLNHNSGISSLSGMANDVKAVREAAKIGSAKALLSMKVFTRSVTKAIGGFCWLLGGLDAIIFTGGIGEHDSQTREEILFDLTQCGVELDPMSAEVTVGGVRTISSIESKIEVLIVPAQEDLMIALHVDEMARLVR